MIEVAEISTVGIGTGNNPNSIASLNKSAQLQKADAKARKNRLLKVINNHVKQSLTDGTNQFPDIIKICYDLRIPYSKFREWKVIDEEFRVKYDEIENMYVERAKKRFIEESTQKGGGWLAREYLRTKDPEWKDKTQNNFFTQINLQMNLKTDGEILGE